MNDLVQRLSEKPQPVEIVLLPERTMNALKDSIERGYVNIRFPNTRGGTELSLPLNREESDLSAANFDEGTGRLIFVGRFTLDYVPVRCTADIDLASLTGTGQLAIEAA